MRSKCPYSCVETPQYQQIREWVIPVPTVHSTEKRKTSVLPRIKPCISKQNVNSLDKVFLSEPVNYIPPLLPWNLEVHCHIYPSLPVVFILNKVNPLCVSSFSTISPPVLPTLTYSFNNTPTTSVMTP
jgi:hypothetical protein